MTDRAAPQRSHRYGPGGTPSGAIGDGPGGTPSGAIGDGPGGTPGAIGGGPGGTATTLAGGSPRTRRAEERQTGSANSTATGSAGRASVFGGAGGAGGGPTSGRTCGACRAEAGAGTVRTLAEVTGAPDAHWVCCLHGRVFHIERRTRSERQRQPRKPPQRQPRWSPSSRATPARAGRFAAGQRVTRYQASRPPVWNWCRPG